MNKQIMNALFPEAVKRVEMGLCGICGKKIDVAEFKDELSKKEYTISGMCQKCQDETFTN